MTYFNDVVEKLSIDELSILGVLFDKKANAVFKSVKNKEVIEDTFLTKSKYFTSLSRLSASCLIETVGSKNDKVYITAYGINALQEQLKGEDY
jgi:hypothetical protein